MLRTNVKHTFYGKEKRPKSTRFTPLDGGGVVKDLATRHDFVNNLSIDNSNVITDNDTFWSVVRNTENRVETLSGTDIFVDAGFLSRSDLGAFIFNDHVIVPETTPPPTLAVPREQVTCATSVLGFGATEGMMIFDITIPPDSGTSQYLFSMDDNSSTNRLLVRTATGTPNFRLTHNVAGSADLNITGTAYSTDIKIAVGWSGSDINVVVDGGTVQTMTTQDGLQFTPQIDFNLLKSQSSGSQFNSVVRSYTTYDYWDTTKAQELTS